MPKCGCDPHVEWCPECRAEHTDRWNREQGWTKCVEQMPPEDKGKDLRLLTWDGYQVRENQIEWSMLMHRFVWKWNTPTPTHWRWMPEPPAV